MAASTSEADDRQVIQIRRTIDTGPPDGLAEGELSVEMGHPGRAVRAWVGVPESVDESGRKLLAAGYATVGEMLPKNPGLGEMHWDKTTAKLFLFDGEQWVIAVNTPGGVAGPSDGSEAAPGEVGEVIFSGAEDALRPFDFPPEPETGETVRGPFGEVYRWDGEKWTLPEGAEEAEPEPEPEPEEVTLRSAPGGSLAGEGQVGEYHEASGENPALFLTSGDWDVAGHFGVTIVPGTISAVEAELRLDGKPIVVGALAARIVLNITGSTRGRLDQAEITEFSAALPTVRLNQTAPFRIEAAVLTAGLSAKQVYLRARRMR